MLIASLLPLLGRYSLGFDLVAGPGETVTLTVIPRATEGKAQRLETGELRPISITATAAEIDIELAKGADGDLAVHFSQEAAAQLARVDCGDAREKAEHQLLLAHLQREDCNRQSVAFPWQSSALAARSKSNLPT